MDRHGTKVKIDRPEAEWLTREAPELRIVPEPLWQAVHARLAGAWATYLRVRHGQAGGRPVNGTEGRYLLTGLGQCGVCGDGMFVQTRGRWERGAATYGCRAYHTRGRAICPNSLEVPLVAADQGVPTAVARDLLRVEVLQTSLAKALDLARPAVDDRTARVPRLRAELAQLEI